MWVTSRYDIDHMTTNFHFGKRGVDIAKRGVYIAKGGVNVAKRGVAVALPLKYII